MATFCYTGSGTASFDSFGLIAYSKCTLSEAGILTSISVYIVNACNVRVALYSNSAGAPDALIVESASVAHAGGGFQLIDVEDTELTAGTYWFAVQVDAAAKYVRYTTGDAQFRQETYAYGAFPASASAGAPSDSKLSLYGTYTPPAYKVEGVTRDSEGNIEGGCTVWLFKTSDKSYVAETTSHASTGAYSFTDLLSEGPYVIRAHKDGIPNIFGTTDDDIVGVEA